MIAARGLQLQRTAVAWERTAFSAAVLGAVMLRDAIDRSDILGVLAGLTMLLTATAMFWGSGRRERDLHLSAKGRARAVAAVAAGVSGTSVLAAIDVIIN